MYKSGNYNFKTIEQAIINGVNKVREDIKPFGAAIPHDMITVIVHDDKGDLKAIKTIQI